MTDARTVERRTLVLVAALVFTVAAVWFAVSALSGNASPPAPSSGGASDAGASSFGIAEGDGRSADRDCPNKDGENSRAPTAVDV